MPAAAEQPAAATSGGAAEAKALSTAGMSEQALYEIVTSLAAQVQVAGALIDIGCGRGELYRRLAGGFDSYLGLDLVRFPDLPSTATFLPVDLNGDVGSASGGKLPVADAVAALSVALGVVEYLDNPRALLREMARITKPGGVAVLSTPNHASLAGRLAFAVGGRVQSTHTARNPHAVSSLLARDLSRAAHDAGLRDVRIVYTDTGRIPGTTRRWPSYCRGPLFSDGVVAICRR